MKAPNTDSFANKAIHLAGGPSSVARHFGIKPWAVSKWERAGKIPAERIPDLVKLIRYEVTPHQLRPDVFIFPMDGVPDNKFDVAQSMSEKEAA